MVLSKVIVWFDALGMAHSSDVVMSFGGLFPLPFYGVGVEGEESQDLQRCCDVC